LPDFRRGVSQRISGQSSQGVSAKLPDKKLEESADMERYGDEEIRLFHLKMFEVAEKTRNSKFEIRNKFEIQIGKFKTQNGRNTHSEQSDVGTLYFRVSDFRFWICFEFRVLNFGFAALPH
jgi:hypothetical protein